MDPETQTAAPEPEVIEAEAPKTDDVKAEDSATSEEPEKKEEDTERKARRNRRTFDQRISQLTAQLREAQRELQEAKKAPEVPEAAPKRDDFDDYEAYADARAEWKAIQVAEKRLKEAEAKQQQARQEEYEARQQQAFAEARDSTLERGVELYPDFEDVTTDEGLVITDAMAEVILNSKRGHELWYHLGKHPEIAESIAAMSPLLQATELGRLESTLSGKKASAAPKPTTTVNSRGATSNALSDNLPLEEWMKRRQEQVRKSV